MLTFVRWEFAFARTEPFAGAVEWRHRFEPEGAGMGQSLLRSSTC